MPIASFLLCESILEILGSESRYITLVRLKLDVIPMYLHGTPGGVQRERYFLAALLFDHQLKHFTFFGR